MRSLYHSLLILLNNISLHLPTSLFLPVPFLYGRFVSVALDLLDEYIISQVIAAEMLGEGDVCLDSRLVQKYLRHQYVESVITFCSGFESSVKYCTVF